MESLSKEEIDLLLDQGDYPEQEWEHDNNLLDKDIKQRRRYAVIRNKLVRKGLIEITRKGYRKCGGYCPAQWKYTPFGEQIANWLYNIESFENALLEMQESIIIKINELCKVLKK